MPDTRKSRILMWKCGSLESTVCYGFISLNRSWNGNDVWNFIKPAPRNSLWGWLLLVASVRNPPFLIVFDRKQWLVLSRKPRSSLSYRFWTLTNVFICSNLQEINFFFVSGLSSGSVSYETEESSDRFRIIWQFVDSGIRGTEPSDNSKCWIPGNQDLWNGETRQLVHLRDTQ